MEHYGTYPNIISIHDKNYIININIEQLESGDWKWEEVILPSKPTYESITNAIITYKYPYDKMQAIINNYLLDSEDLNIKNEFNEMQNWRKYAKNYAKQILNEKDI